MIEELKPLLGKLSVFAKDRLQFKRPPKLFLKNDSQNSKQALGKTAFYDPNEESVTLFIHARHPKDILRSLAHELVHHTQNLRGDLNPEKMGTMSKNYAQDNEHMRNMEKEAYLQGNMCFRDWEDSLDNKELFTIKLAESKFLKENKTMTTKITKEFLKNTIREILKKQINEQTQPEEEEEVPPMSPELQALINQPPGPNTDPEVIDMLDKLPPSKAQKARMKAKMMRDNPVLKALYAKDGDDDDGIDLSKDPLAGATATKKPSYDQKNARYNKLMNRPNRPMQANPGWRAMNKAADAVGTAFPQKGPQLDKYNDVYKKAFVQAKIEDRFAAKNRDRDISTPELRRQATAYAKKILAHPAFKTIIAFQTTPSEEADHKRAFQKMKDALDNVEKLKAPGQPKNLDQSLEETQEESKVQIPEQENTLYEQRFTPKNNRLFEKLVKEWTK